MAANGSRRTTRKSRLTGMAPRARSWSPKSRSMRTFRRALLAGSSPMLGSLRRAWARLLPDRQNRRHEGRAPRRPDPGIEPERIANRFARSRNGA